MTRLYVTPEASTLHDGAVANLRTITSALSAGFTTPGGIEQALQAITDLQATLPVLRRELRMMRAGLRRVA